MVPPLPVLYEFHLPLLLPQSGGLNPRWSSKAWITRSWAASSVASPRRCPEPRNLGRGGGAGGKRLRLLVGGVSFEGVGVAAEDGVWKRSMKHQPEASLLQSQEIGFSGRNQLQQGCFITCSATHLNICESFRHKKTHLEASLMSQTVPCCGCNTKDGQARRPSVSLTPAVFGDELG